MIVFYLGLLALGGFRWESPADRPFDGQIVYVGAAKGSQILAWNRTYCDQIAELPPILGQQTRKGSDLVFKPQFPLEPGSQFCVFLMSPNREILAAWELNLPKIDTVKTLLIGHWPAADVLPQNLLRFYLTFSQPMKRAWDVKHIILLDSGVPIETAFVEIDAGLWNEAATRLTLILHPGRVKRGVGSHEAMGPVLQAGHHYQLKIEGLQDAYGQVIEPWSTHFVVGEPDFDSPDPGRWNLELPHANSRDALFLEVPEEIDPFILQRSLSIHGPKGKILGAISLMRNQWVFTPLQPWPQGDFRLHFESFIEDWAGNRPGRLFESASPDDREMSSERLFQIQKTI
ncbi:MAG: hypothetical protein H6510_08305 [Acidobacteria bacterium]|nr:hypothetical protein [Acidobacteriota bacterium]